MSDYIVCLGRPSKPQLHNRICANCEKHERCLSYKTWILTKVKIESKDKTKWDEETKKRESLLRGLIKAKTVPEVQKVRKVRRAK